MKQIIILFFSIVSFSIIALDPKFISQDKLIIGKSGDNPTISNKDGSYQIRLNSSEQALQESIDGGNNWNVIKGGGGSGALSPNTAWSTPETVLDPWGNFTVTARYRRVGPDAVIEWEGVANGAVPTGVTLYLGMPSGLVIDSANMLNRFSAWGWANPSSTQVMLGGYVNGTDNDRVYVRRLATNVNQDGATINSSLKDVSLSSDGVYANGAVRTWTSGEYVKLTMTLPIVGWDTGLNVATATTELAGAVYSGAGVQTIADGAGETVTLQTVEINNGGFTTGSNALIIPKNACYIVSASVGVSDASTGRIRLSIRNVGKATIVDSLGSANSSGNGTVTTAPKLVCLEQGDSIDLYFSNSTGVTQTILTDTNRTYLSIVEHKSSGVIAGTFDDMKVECQEKDLTQLTNDGTAATLNNLTVDRCYTVHLQTYYSGVQSGEQINCIFRDAGNTKRVTETRVYGIVDGSSTIAINSSVGASKQFPAVGSSYEVVCDFLDSTLTNGTLVGGAGNGRSYVQLCEMPTNYICSGSTKFD